MINGHIVRAERTESILDIHILITSGRGVPYETDCLSPEIAVAGGIDVLPLGVIVLGAVVDECAA